MGFQIGEVSARSWSQGWPRELEDLKTYGAGMRANVLRN
jgi:hypothetical protein